MAGGEQLRVAVLVDVQNLYHSARESIASNVSYDKLMKAAVRRRLLVRAFAYLVDSEEISQEGFVRALEQLHFTVRRKPLLIRVDGTEKGNWDIGLTIDAVRIAGRVDVVCLVTGDGDFVPLVEYLQSHSVRVELYSFPQQTARSLIEAADHYYPLDETFAYERR